MLNSNLLRKLDMQDLMVFIAVYDQSSVTEVSETPYRAFYWYARSVKLLGCLVLSSVQRVYGRNRC